MRTVQAGRALRDKVSERLFGIARVFEDLRQGHDPRVAQQRRAVGDRHLLGQAGEVTVRVTVPAASSITGPATLFEGPPAKLVIDLPLSAVKTYQKVPLANGPPLARSRTTDVPCTVAVPLTPQTSSAKGPRAFAG